MSRIYWWDRNGGLELPGNDGYTNQYILEIGDVAREINTLIIISIIKRLIYNSVNCRSTFKFLFVIS